MERSATTTVLRNNLRAAVWVCLWGGSGLAHAHPGLDARIAAASEAIATDASPSAFIGRARLHLEHEDPSAALADLAAALEADGPTEADRREVRWLRARAAAAAGDHQGALTELNAIQAHDEEGSSALLLRSRALAGLDRPAEALGALQRAMATIEEPSVDQVMELARLHEASGEVGEALRAIDQGLTDHRGATVLRVEAFRLTREHRSAAEALSRHALLPGPLRNSPEYCLERAELLWKSGDDTSARSALAQAHQALDALPERRRDSPAMRALDLRAVLLSAEMSKLSTSALSQSRVWKYTAAKVIAAMSLALLLLGLYYRRRERARLDQVP